MVVGMDEDASQRKARLKALREKAATAGDDEPAAKRQKEDEGSKPVLKFRNYKATAEDLKEKEVPRLPVPDIGEQVVEQVEAGKQTESAKVDLLNLAPRKPDWDLKRDCAARMEKLQRRTQRAVAQIVRERLADDGDLADAVAATEAPDNGDSD